MAPNRLRTLVCGVFSDSPLPTQSPARDVHMLRPEEVANLPRGGKKYDSH